MSDDSKKFFEDEEGRHILIPEGQTVENVVDDLHAAETDESLVADGKHSDLLERALEDKATAEDRGDILDPPQELFVEAPDLGGIPLYQPGDLAGYAEARAGNVEIDGNTLIVHLDNSEAGRRLQEVMQEPRIMAMSIFEPIGENDDKTYEATTLEQEISRVLNNFSAENASGTPDYILAEYLIGCLKAYNAAVQARAQWNGKPLDRFGHEEEEILDARTSVGYLIPQLDTNRLYSDLAADETAENTNDSTNKENN